MSGRRYVAEFSTITPDDWHRCGGKGRSLAQLWQADLPVPPGFVVTTDAFLAARDRSSGSGARRFLPDDVPADVCTEIDAAYQHLSQTVGTTDLPVAVRSSATVEDGGTASFAGEFETLLGRRGTAAVRTAVAECWSSLLGDRGQAYLEKERIEPDSVAMAVVVQTMVVPRCAGVMFTIHPVTGDRMKMVIECSWGVGVGVVGGEVTPDRFTIDKLSLQCVDQRIARKEIEYIQSEDGVRRVAVPAERAALPSLTHDELREVAELGRMIEKDHGAAQDIEWAVEASTGRVVLLQSRQETVWSRRDRRLPFRSDGSVLDWITESMTRHL